MLGWILGARKHDLYVIIVVVSGIFIVTLRTKDLVFLFSVNNANWESTGLAIATDASCLKSASLWFMSSFETADINPAADLSVPNKLIGASNYKKLNPSRNSEFGTQ